MEALIGITGKNFTILAADNNVARSIVVMKSTEEKFRELGKNVSMAYSGEPGEGVNFAEFVEANVKLYEMKNDIPLSTKAVAHFTRRLISDALRTKSPHPVNALIGGCSDKDSCGQLYWLDFYGTLTSAPFAAQGHAAYFVLSLMDRHYKEGMSFEEGMELMKMCISELKTRFLVNFPSFSLRIIRPEGIENATLKV